MAPGGPPRLEVLARLDEATRRRLGRLVELLAEAPDAPSSVTDPEQAWRVHVADSLVALELAALREAKRLADLGSGAGFPGLPLALGMGGARVDLIEATGRKCAFLERAIDATAADNTRVVNERAETWATEGAPGRERYDLVTARAVGSLATLCELASPLLRQGGTLVAWKGRRDRAEEGRATRAGRRTAMEPVEVRRVAPFPGSRDRHLHLYAKRGPTPPDLPRRPGRARKRPFGGEGKE
jgi:16S rRNA (guanine527-N7)-methyltransferase